VNFKAVVTHILQELKRRGWGKHGEFSENGQSPDLILS